MRNLKSFSDMDKTKGKVGSKVAIYNFYDNKFNEVVTEVVSITRNGINGITLELEDAPMPESSVANKFHSARYVKIISI